MRLVRGIRTLFRLALFASLGAAAGQPQEPKLFYGLLHAHTYFSDGSGTPEQAYARAKSKGVDFFALTEHNHKDAERSANDRIDQVLIATDPRLYEAASGTVQIQRLGQTVTVKSLIRAAKDATTPTFVALYGQEFSSISKGNHVNVLQIDKVLTAPNGDFRSLYDHLGTQLPAAVVQMNHPDVHADLFYAGQDREKKRNMFNDYGLDDYGLDFSTLVEETGRFVSLIELLSGPALTPERSAGFSYQAHENDYFYYLTQGFHVSPSTGHDNHYETWGDMTDARMGVYAAELTAASLLEAFRVNRTFATEDKDLALGFSINGQPMGSVLTLSADAELVIRVTASDPSDGNTAYDVVLVQGHIAPQREAAFQKLMAEEGEVDRGTMGPSGSLELRGHVASGTPEFFYVKVVQGDGDRAWSAPIWINHPQVRGEGDSSPTLFVWWFRPAKMAHFAHLKWATSLT